MLQRLFLFAASSVLLLGGLAFAEESKAEHSHGGAASEHTLKTVMQHLAAAEMEIQMGLLTNNRLMIQTGAKAIAHHPNPKGGIKPYIKKNHEALKGTIKSMDEQVHGSAVEIFKKSQTAPMAELQVLNAKMVSGCISCHNVFRD